MHNDDDLYAVFSLERRRAIERERNSAGLVSLATAARVLPRFMYQRELREARIELRKAERRAARRHDVREARAEGLWALVDVLKEQVRRLVTDERPAMVAAGDDAARAIEQRPSAENGSKDIERVPPQHPEPPKTNGSTRRSPWG